MTLVKEQRSAFWAGFRALMPLWLGAIPFALAYVIAARQVGLSDFEIQLMSLSVFSAAAQLSMLGLLASGAAFWQIVVVVIALTAQSVLYGLALTQKLRLSKPQRLFGAFFLTDGAYALTVAAEARATFAFLLGTELSMFAVWNGGTLIGLLFAPSGLDPVSTGLNFIIPLTFLVLLVTMLKKRFDVLILVLAIGSALIFNLILPGGLTVLVTGIITGLVGAWLVPGKTHKAKG